MISSRRAFCRASLSSIPAAVTATAGDKEAAPAVVTDRKYWVEVLLRLANPVLNALSEHRLKQSMPVEAAHGNAADRSQYTHLEALGRLLAGIAPWLESQDEIIAETKERQNCRDLARHAIAAAVDPSSPDRMNFNRGTQPVVDAAFLALALLRAPVELWQRLEDRTKSQLIDALVSTRVIRPGFNNWLLFSATVEAFLASVGHDWDAMRVDYAVRQHEEWYKGDGMYGDGPQFHWDYYNSFVIHPMLLEVLDVVGRSTNTWETFKPAVLARAKRFAAIQERMISPEGTYPPLGRSLSYRCGAFHLLALIALRKQLPDGLSPEQVRSALSAVLKRSIEAPGTFDEHGWLTIGVCGHQPDLGESYISTGSLYLCSTALLPLGLTGFDPFWSNQPQPWTSQRIWNGENVKADHAI